MTFKLTTEQLLHSKVNPILNIDSYKASHYLQYPEQVEYLNSYIESRGGLDKATIFFGLQAFIKEYLLTPITQQDLEVAEQLIKLHGLPFNRAGWQYIIDHHQGYLPLEIYSVAEATLVETHNVLVQVRNSDPHCAWLPSYIETSLLRAIWYPTSVATKSFKIKQLLFKYLEQTSDNWQAAIDFKLHDFGARSASSYQSSELGGMAHLLSFKGSDTTAALIAVNRYYNQTNQVVIPGYSIPAAEHSTITSWGLDHELAAFDNMLQQFAQPGNIFAIVCDSYDLFHAVQQHLGESLKGKIISSNATLVIRPDSGDPVAIVLELAQLLERIFGCEVNSKGYKLFNHVRIIQGDGVNYDSINKICEGLIAAQFSIDNIAFGMGTELLQNVNRDTQRFAQKASAVYKDGAWLAIRKQPITDPGKLSKKGIQKLILNNGVYQTQAYTNPSYPLVLDQDDCLELVYKDGKLYKEYQWQELTDLINQQLKLNKL